MTVQTIAFNRKAYHDYHVLEKIEAGIALTGTEIKSIRAGRVNLRHAFAKPENDELWLLEMHIARYDAGSRHNHEPTRRRKLLLHRKQLDNLISQLTQKGLTLVPLRLYIKNRLAKIELGLVKGKKLHDKRQSIIRREGDRQVERALKSAMMRKGQKT